MAFAHLQSAGASSAHQPSSQAVTFGGSATVGSLVVVGLAMTHATVDRTVGVTDNKGNTYTRHTRTTHATGWGGRVVLEIWYCKITTGGSSFTVTMTPDATCYCNICISEYSGLGVNTPFLGAFSTNYQTNINTTSGSTGSITISGTGLDVDYAVCAQSDGTNNNWGAVTGNILRYSQNFDSGGDIVGFAALDVINPAGSGNIGFGQVTANNQVASLGINIGQSVPFGGPRKLAGPGGLAGPYAHLAGSM